MEEADLREVMERAGASIEAEPELSATLVANPSDSLFDIDDHQVEHVPVRRRPLQHAPDSSDGTCPPTSESDTTGFNTSFEDNEEQNLPVAQGKRSKVVTQAAIAQPGKRKNARQEARSREEQTQISRAETADDIKEERKGKRQRKHKESKQQNHRND